MHTVHTKGDQTSELLWVHASPKNFSALAITHHRMKTSRSRAASAKKNTLAPLQDSTTAAGSGQHACQLPELLLLARALAAATACLLT